MPIYSRPLSLDSFIWCSLPVALVLAPVSSGCLAPPTEDAPAKQQQAGANDTKANTKANTTGTPAKADGGPADPDGAQPASDECCKYCFAGTPCGDECLPEGKTCDTPEGDGCACTADERPTRTFEKGWQPPPNSGLLGPDVFAYNKAQGDPIDGPFTLEMAFEGAPELADTSKGKLTVTFETSMGDFDCTLFEDKAPLTVANFIGLARGLRPYKDPKKGRKNEEWTKGAYYDGVVFHRVIADFMVQTGDPTGSGRGTPGYFIPDEFHPDLRHSGPGILSMANRNPYDRRTNKPVYDDKTGLTVGNTGSAQFFITVRATEPLNDRHTIFGRCETKIPIEISKVRTQSRPQPDKPFEDVTIEKLTFSRK